ncbi:hypothetical protein ILUMI_06235 [Ignelater luminosus]|uniref:Uncharacterized protein n=1 Tax=Ignelater luminosus TaxID=2038154 RepID=A0A8K0D9M5_IGNLU|nr:hypothetical protein ILUMI_06235 [Ignelater luminosus]
MREPHVEPSHIPDLFVEVLLLWFSESFGLGSSLFGTGRGPGVDIVVIAGAGIISVDMEEGNSAKISRRSSSSSTEKSEAFLQEVQKQIEDVLFWPDMATSHYSKEIRNLLKYVIKYENLSNFPQGKAIENFWALQARVQKKKAAS